MGLDTVVLLLLGNVIILSLKLNWKVTDLVTYGQHDSNQLGINMSCLDG